MIFRLIRIIRILLILILKLVAPGLISVEIAYNTVDNPFLNIYNFLIFVITFITPWVIWEIILWAIYHGIAVYNAKKMIRLKITLPKNDAKEEKEKETKKDFKEKVAIMEQFFRGVHEIGRLTLKNYILSTIFGLDKISYELVAENEELNFYIVVLPYYRTIVEKQITAFYPEADIEEEKEDYVNLPSGYNIKAFYLYLSEPFWKPIRTYKNFEDDPLNSITNAFSKLTKDDKAIVQIVTRSVNSKKYEKKAHKIADDAFRRKDKALFLSKIPILKYIGNLISFFIEGNPDALGTNAPGASQGDSFIRMIQPMEEALKASGEKAGDLWFECGIEILTFSKKDKKRAEDIMNNIVVAFNVFKAIYNNNFVNRRILPFDFISTPLLYFSLKYRLINFFQKKDLLVASELATVYHFPDAMYNKSPVIKWLDYKVVPAPLEIPKSGDLLLGINKFRGEERKVYMNDKDRTRHHYIIGKSGSGKSALISFLARQDIQNNKGVCVIDPHGDLIDDVLCYIPKERAKEVIVFDPSNDERPMGLNILEAKTPQEMDRASLDATEIFIKLFGNEIFGPRIQHYFRNACLTLMEDTEEGATIIDVPRIFTDPPFLEYKLKKTKNPVVKSFWVHEYAKTGDREKQEMIPYFNAKFGPFITNTTMRNIIGQSKSAFNLRKIMDNGEVLLVNLSKGKIGGLNAQLLGLIFVNKINMSALQRGDTLEKDRKFFAMYVDEFQNFATETFATILSEARKYNLALIMAHQYINQLIIKKIGEGQSSEIKDAVFGNVGTMMSFKVGAEDAEHLVKEYAPTLSTQDIIGISKFKAYTKLCVKNSTSRPFSIETIWDETGKNEKIANVIKKYSSIKYGRKRKFVDLEIETRIGIS